MALKRPFSELDWQLTPEPVRQYILRTNGVETAGSPVRIAGDGRLGLLCAQVLALAGARLLRATLFRGETTLELVLHDFAVGPRPALEGA